jgi:hypothetical protein
MTVRDLIHVMDQCSEHTIKPKTRVTKQPLDAGKIDKLTDTKSMDLM